MIHVKQSMLTSFFFFHPFLGDENKELPDIVKGQWALKKCPLNILGMLRS